MNEFKKHRLDMVKPSPFDPRDIYFSNKMCSTIILPDEYDLSGYIKRIENQGTLGSCSGQGSSYMMETLEAIAQKPHYELSPMYLYYKEREMEGTVKVDSGAYIRDAMKVLQKHGICKESLHPYVERNFAQKPSEEAEQDAKNHMIEGYQRLTSVNQIKTCIAQNKPVLIGMKLYTSFDTKMVELTGIVPMPNKAKEKYDGSHCMLISGFNDNFANERNIKVKPGMSGGYFKVVNSWGSNWGENGFCYIPYEMIEEMHDIWAVKEGPTGNIFASIVNVIKNLLTKRY